MKGKTVIFQENIRSLVKGRVERSHTSFGFKEICYSMLLCPISLLFLVFR